MTIEERERVREKGIIRNRVEKQINSYQSSLARGRIYGCKHVCYNNFKTNSSVCNIDCNTNGGVGISCECVGTSCGQKGRRIEWKYVIFKLIHTEGY